MRGKIIFVLILILFVALHIPGLHIPYHQDEYKWVYYSHPEITPPGTVPHPPLTEFIYARLGPIVGDNNFRMIPFVFGILDFFLLFYLAKILFDKKTALWTVSLFTVSYYSLLATLTVDVDGAVMPFFLLLLSIGYVKFKEGNPRWLWLVLAGAVGGFLVKVSFAVCLAAFALDFLIEKKVLSDKRKILKYSLALLGGIGALVLLLLGAKFIFPFFNLAYALKYWEHFAVFKDRGWFQTFIQFAKSLLYTSPLLILPVIFVDKEIWVKTRVFFFFIFLGLLFYLFAFDFSLGALDRYFQFLVTPLCIISGAVFAQKINFEKKDVALVSLIGLGVFALQFFKQFVPPLYPKAEWISRALHFKWQFLFPFTGGSGPTGFYVSFSFIALIWIVSLIFTLSSLKMKEVRGRALFCLLILGIIYNGVFLEEYLFGKINGSPVKLFENAKAYIKKDQQIKSVVVYNDIGGFEIQKLGKYERRLYAAPQFENTYREYFKNYSGYILYVDIPKIGENNFYSNYLATCKSIYRDSDQYINSNIFKCSPLK
jgi:hypothetical protein